MGQFRDRMDDELRIRGYSASTRECYVRCVRNFVRHFMRPPDQLTLEHIRQYQLHLTRDRHVAWTYFNQVVCALRFFYREVLKKDWEVRHIPYQKAGRKLPEILSTEMDLSIEKQKPQGIRDLHHLRANCARRLVALSREPSHSHGPGSQVNA